MIKGSITYRDLTSKLLTYINNNCQNIDTIDNIEVCFKTGYLYSTYNKGKIVIPHTHDSKSDVNFQPRADFQIKNDSCVSAVSKSTIESQFNNFLASIGVSSKLDTQIKDGELFHIINELVRFCCSKLFMIIHPHLLL